MELPHVGKQCSKQACNQLDFLPIKCDACQRIFCNEHYRYSVHNCPNAYTKNNQVPACPLCNKPVPISKGQSSDYTVSIHIDNDCQSDPAKDRRRVFTNKCSVRGCKIKEVIPVLCSECRSNYCLKHRHPSDHKCMGTTTFRKRSANAAESRSANRIGCNAQTIQGNMSEDEALAQALALSMQDTRGTKKSQEELDEQLARQLQMEPQTTTVGNARTRRGDQCSVS